MEEQDNVSKGKGILIRIILDMMTTSVNKYHYAYQHHVNSSFSMD